MWNHQLQNTEYRIQNKGFKMQNTGSRTEYRIPNQNTGYRKKRIQAIEKKNTGYRKKEYIISLHI